MARTLEGLGYGLSQSARVAWFYGHSLAASRLRGAEVAAPATHARAQERLRGQRPRAAKAAEGPGRATFYRALYELFEDDWGNIKAGLYAPPHDLSADPRSLVALSGRFLKDARRVALRRAEGRVRELPEREKPARYPAYYRQNFHFQTDGYLSEESAALYDFQVETLFLGAADAMRRAALPMLAAAIKGRDQRKLKLVDLGCGTGRFLVFVKDNYPRLNVCALDLSPYYLAEAQKALSSWSGIELIQGKAEAVPLARGAADIVTAIYLFHELPQSVRKEVASEIARLLKRNGTFILVDSLQMGDRKEFDGLLHNFPLSFHEPYYASYTRENLAALFGGAGLKLRRESQAFLSKVSVFEKM